MSNRYMKEVPIFDIKAGTEFTHDLYGIGKVVASYPMEGVVDLGFKDGHIEYGFDIKSQTKPTEVLKIEAFKCPITNEDVLAERCACIKDGIHACDYFKTDLEKKESSCIYESEMQRIASEEQENIKKEAKVSQEKQDAVNGLRNLITKYLKEAKFEDVLGPVPEGITAENKALYVQHKVTGTKGVISNIVASNAVEVTWKNQEETECPCKTIVTKEEIEKDSDASIWCKIKEVQEKLKKKFVKPINEFFKKKASVEDNLIKIDADKILNKLTVMSEVKKQSYLQAIKSQLNSIGIDVEDSSILLDSNGFAKSFSVIKASSHEIYPEYVTNISRKKVAQKLGYDGDVLKIYASLKGQLNTVCSEDGFKNFIENDLSKDNNLNTLF